MTNGSDGRQSGPGETPSNSKESFDSKLQERNNKEILQVPTWAEVFPSMYYFEVVKNGALAPNISLIQGRKAFVVGRSERADATLHHYLLSRFHVMIVYGCNGEIAGTKRPQFWVCDLNTSNGTKLNKKRLAPEHFYPMETGHMLQFCDTPYTLVLQGPVEHSSDDTTEPMAEEFSKMGSDRGGGITWGMNRYDYGSQGEADGNNHLAVSTARPDDDTTTIEKPTLLLKRYFAKMGLDVEYDVSTTTDSEGKTVFTASVDLCIYDDDGTELSVDASASKRNLAIEQCAKKACQTIINHGLDFEEDTETAAQRKRRMLEENDYYELEDDSYLDRSGQVEMKRLDRMKRMKKMEVPLENHATLSAKLDIVRKDMEDLTFKLSQAGEIPEDGKEGVADEEDDDDLDLYMKDLHEKMNQKRCEELKKRIAELKMEEVRLNKLLSYCMPSSTFNRNSNVVISSNKVVVPPSTQVADESPHPPSREKVDPTPPRKKAILREEKAPRVSQTVAGTKVGSSRKEEHKRYMEEEEAIGWMPPEGQSGDGRTSLNDKLGY